MRNRTKHERSRLTAISDAGSTPAASTIHCFIPGNLQIKGDIPWPVVVSSLRNLCGVRPLASSEIRSAAGIADLCAIQNDRAMQPRRLCRSRERRKSLCLPSISALDPLQKFTELSRRGAP